MSIQHLKRTLFLLIIVFFINVASLVTFKITPVYADIANYFTGCIKTAKGTFYNMRVGTTPAASCSVGDSLVSGDYGDITSVSVGSGLTGGATQGDTTISLADLGVTTNKLGDGAVTSAKILNEAVGTGQLADNAIASAKLLDLAVTTSKLGDGAVTTSKLADNSVTSVKISDDAVTPNKISNDATENSRIQTWADDTTDYSFDATGNNTPKETIDPNISITVPTGKAYYYMVTYDGIFQYYYSDRTSSDTNFHGQWKASLLDSTTVVSLTTDIVDTGYRYDWANLGGTNYWQIPVHATWYIRLGEGTHPLKVQIAGYSDGTMNYAHIIHPHVQLVRTF